MAVAKNGVRARCTKLANGFFISSLPNSLTWTVGENAVSPERRWITGAMRDDHVLTSEVTRHISLCLITFILLYVKHSLTIETGKTHGSGQAESST